MGSSGINTKVGPMSKLGKGNLELHFSYVQRADAIIDASKTHLATVEIVSLNLNSMRCFLCYFSSGCKSPLSECMLKSSSWKPLNNVNKIGQY